MPKEKKVKRSCALEKQLAFDAQPWYKKPSKKQVKPSGDENEMESEYVPENLTRKTLELARQQQLEEEETTMDVSTTNAPTPAKSDYDTEEEDEAFVDEDDEEDDDLVRMNNGYIEDVEISEADEQALESFMPSGFGETRNLADIIMEKIREKEAQENGEMEGPAFDPKIIQVYSGVGTILKRYSSGKLPKAFKIIPSLSHWEDVLWLTRPDEWSPHSMFAATKIFASNLNPRMAQRFYNIFLLEHVRQDIRENKRLNYHLYMALKKALYKPQAFFRGIVLPLCESNNCTLREATIIGSVLVKVSVPVIHSAVALMKIAEMPYSGANSMFIRILLNKKYSLPTRVIVAVSAHFERFISDSRELPVLWHQSLMAFVQRYKTSLTPATRENFKVLMKQHFHHQITPEIRRELFAQ